MPAAKSKRAPRRCWTPEEEAFLADAVKRLGTKKWSVVADHLQNEFNNDVKRTGKQCRTRWLNHLDPNINKGP